MSPGESSTFIELYSPVLSFHYLNANKFESNPFLQCDIEIGACVEKRFLCYSCKLLSENTVPEMKKKTRMVFHFFLPEWQVVFSFDFNERKTTKIQL